MSTYVMSDLHGQYYPFKKMLRNIRFSKEDHLYILGDVVDRGPEPIRLLKEIKTADNITLLYGNHEDMMLDFYKDKNLHNWHQWANNGGYVTQTQFDYLPEEERAELLTWIESLPVTIELTVNNQEYVLGHACPFGSNTLEKIWFRLKPYDEAPDDGKIYICGHTPIISFNRAEQKTAHMKRNIDERIWFIDCGCAYGTLDKRARLCCLRLDDGKEFYSSLRKRKTPSHDNL